MRAWVLAAAAACFLPRASLGGPKAHQMEVVFGITEHLPLRPEPKLADDYVPNSKTVVPNAVRRCGGNNVGYHLATDGAATVSFSRSRSKEETVGCIKRLLPQVGVMIIEDERR